ncbi:Uma2 family endonuclease [Chelatococcus sambhunathii]|uniref:Uma2 family endonuclease n=1 Tax=Chelatococcus sambhunathii TaxID=363953 RepID=A0ABU1DDB8_9HYPH|nr:Uma2 family endonuclease [Chelatococcus sambhunathii]MDR4306113.1 Uma2 family endonuclease [Chelatococcus sambhunathii]
MNQRFDLSVPYRLAELEPGMAVPVETFLDWIDTQEGKYEYDRGTIGMMVRVSRNHAKLSGNFAYLLMQALDGRGFDVLTEAFGVHTKNSVRFPDVLVQEQETDGRALASKAPLLIVEVLSPSSLYADHVVKRDEYLDLPTLQVYVVADPNTAKLTVWERADGGAFPDAPNVVEGLEATLNLRALGLSLALGGLYRGVSFPPPAP